MSERIQRRKHFVATACDDAVHAGTRCRHTRGVVSDERRHGTARAGAEVERRGAHHGSQKEEPPLHAPDRQRLVDRFQDDAEQRLIRHCVSPGTASCLGEQPGHEVDRADGHANAEDDARQPPGEGVAPGDRVEEASLVLSPGSC